MSYSRESLEASLRLKTLNRKQALEDSLREIIDKLPLEFKKKHICISAFLKSTS